MLERPTLPPHSRDGKRLHTVPRSHTGRPLCSLPGGLPYPVASTPMPNRLLDQVMPTLSDSEWRLMCVICRQTLGFASGDGTGRRRVRDWLSHRQLKARMGRASAAVSKAVDGLVRKNLIAVQGIDGQPLVTPAERRRCQGALFFSLAPRVLQAAGEMDVMASSNSAGEAVENPVENGFDE